MAAAEALGVDYKRSDPDYGYRLKEIAHNNVKELSPHLDTYK
jgi:hypothetical protein